MLPNSRVRRRQGRRSSSTSPCALLALVLVLLPPLAAACGSDNQAMPASSTSQAVTTPPSSVQPAVPLPVAVQHLEIAGDEYGFDVEPVDRDEINAGWTKVTFHNVGVEAHQVMFASLKPGVDLAQLAAAAGEDSSGSGAIEFVDMLGGVSYIGPGQTIEAMVELPEGVVMAMCYVPDPDGVAHALSGMSTMLTVGPASTTEAAGTGDEMVQGTITMTAVGYSLPDALPAGWYKVVNEDGGAAGEGLHELSILGLEDPLDPGGLDQLVDELANNKAPSVPVVALGGMGALSGGFEGYLFLDLASGPYLAVDFMPDPGAPRPHLLDGYVTTFEA